LERRTERRVLQNTQENIAMSHQVHSDHSRRGWGTIVSFAATLIVILGLTMWGLGELPTLANAPAPPETTTVGQSRPAPPAAK
jgi:hypothetical protein